MNKEKWRVWDDNKEYGEVFYKRSVGELGEMESSKALAKIMEEYFESGTIVDVGCGAGHYLRSLRNKFGKDFDYLGVDATEYYIELAKKAYSDDKRASFLVGDIFDLPLESKISDVTISNNLFLHLPSIVKPIEELIRITKKYVIIRTLCGDRSFRIMNIHKQRDNIEFESDGEPKEFHYFNIYNKDYIKEILASIPRVEDVIIDEDVDYNCKNIEAAIAENGCPDHATTIINGKQVNGYIIQPWCFVKIKLRD